MISVCVCVCLRNGPIFGSGADLCISNECNRNKDSYSQLPYTYGDMDLPNYLLTGEFCTTISKSYLYIYMHELLFIIQ